MGEQQEDSSLGLVRSWGAGREVVVLSNPLVDPSDWSAPVRGTLVSRGYRVTTFEHQPVADDWRSVVECVSEFIDGRPAPVAVLGWSQGAAIAQEAALACGEQVTCAALLATYGRQNEADKVLQACLSTLAAADDDLDPVRLAVGLLTAFPPGQLADDAFVRRMTTLQPAWAARPDPDARRRASAFVASYQDRLEALSDVAAACLVMAFELDTDTFAARARKVAAAIPGATYLELPDLPTRPR